jgi:hypothetical protein
LVKFLVLPFFIAVDFYIWFCYQIKEWNFHISSGIFVVTILGCLLSSMSLSPLVTLLNTSKTSCKRTRKSLKSYFYDLSPLRMKFITIKYSIRRRSHYNIYLFLSLYMRK